MHEQKHENSIMLMIFWVAKKKKIFINERVEKIIAYFSILLF